jgi:hypothetical protein
MTRLEYLNNHAPKELIRELFTIQQQITDSIEMLLGLKLLDMPDDYYDTLKEHCREFVLLCNNMPYGNEGKIQRILDIANKKNE